MNFRIASFVAGAAAGALAMSLISHRSAESAADRTDEGTPGQSIFPDRQQQKIAALEQKIAELEADRPALAIQDTEGSAAGTKQQTSVKIFGADSNSKIDLAEIQKHMERAESQRAAKRIAADLASLSSALDLTDEQAEQVRALLEKREAQHAGQLGGILRLATSAVDGDEAAISDLVAGAQGGAVEDADDFDFDAEMLALLDGEQVEAYQDYQRAQQENHIEASANRQLAQLQTVVPDLSKEQKDQAFNEFARIARDDVEAGGGPQQGLPSGAEIGRMLSQCDAEKQAMQQILSPEQFEVYESNSGRALSFGAPAGATIISSEIIVDPDLVPAEIAPIEGE